MDTNRPLKILFSSYHSYFDPSSGATISLRDMFQLLGPLGWDCQAFCGPQLDFEEPTRIPDLWRSANIPFQERAGQINGTDFILYNAIIDGVPTAAYETPQHPPARVLSGLQGQMHLALLKRVLEQFRPEIVLTYGGQVMAIPAMAEAHRAGAAVVFWLRNMAYNNSRFFRLTDGVLVPSTFSASLYQKTIGLSCTAIPSPLDWDRVNCGHVQRRYLTFINPVPAKGVFLFAGIVRELAARRPDIPVLVVESRGKADWLEKAGLDRQQLPNLHLMLNTRDPKQFFGVTKTLLVPSIWNETFGRVAAEAMVNGIPVLASNRGGLPDVVGRGGFVIPVPPTFTPKTHTVPEAHFIKPWVDTIVRLWDDQSFYVTACLRARTEAGKWNPERLARQYDDYFRNLLRQRTATPRGQVV